MLIALLDVAEIVQIQILDWSHEKRCQNFSFPNFLPQLQPQLDKRYEIVCLAGSIFPCLVNRGS